MDNYRLKIKIGDHEFEAEGSTEAVQSQFEAFKDLIASLPQKSASQNIVANTQMASGNIGSATESALALDKVTRIDERVVSLTAKPEKIEDGLLIMLLGQRTFRGNDSVTGGELIEGMRQSGINVGRIDWRLEKLAGEGLVIKIGSGRASRYRLTNQGMSKAQGIARNLIALVP